MRVEATLNIEHIKQEYRAFCDGDFEAMGRMLAPEAVWHVSGRRTASGDKQGKDQILQFLRHIASETHENFRIELHDILANERHVVVLAHVTATTGDETYQADEVHLYHVDNEGLIHEAWGFTADPAGQGAFWF